MAAQSRWLFDGPWARRALTFVGGVSGSGVKRFDFRDPRIGSFRSSTAVIRCRDSGFG
jgi:hypothetical protein